MDTTDLVDTLTRITGVTVTAERTGLLRITTAGTDEHGDPIPPVDLDPAAVNAARLGNGPLGLHAELTATDRTRTARTMIVATGDIVFEPVPRPDLLGDSLPVTIHGLPEMVSWTETIRHLDQPLLGDDGDFDLATARLHVSAAFLNGADTAGVDLPASAIERFEALIAEYFQQ